MPVTLHYAGALAIVFLVLTARVMQGRMGKAGPSLGDGGDLGMLRRIRGHANFAEYVPLILVMMGLLEADGSPAWVLHGLGGTLVVARVLHGYAFAFTLHWVVGRTAGIMLTLLTLCTASLLCLLS
jgi:uncharacterized membrane protein YecN with MAPEG domain